MWVEVRMNGEVSGRNTKANYNWNCNDLLLSFLTPHNKYWRVRVGEGVEERGEETGRKMSARRGITIFKTFIK